MSRTPSSFLSLSASPRQQRNPDKPANVMDLLSPTRGRAKTRVGEDVTRNLCEIARYALTNPSPTS